MSGLIEKVKDAVRSKSQEQDSTITTQEDESRRSDDQYVGLQNTSEIRDSTQLIRRGQKSEESEGIGGTTKSFTRLNLDSSRNGTIAISIPSLLGNDTNEVKDERVQTSFHGEQHRDTSLPNGHGPTPRTPTHQRNISGSSGGLGNPSISPDIVPDRASSKKRRSMSSSKKTASPRTMRNPQSEHEAAGRFSEPRTTPKHRSARSVDVAPNDPSPLIPHFANRSPNSPRVTDLNHAPRAVHHRDLRVPAAFDLSNSESTHVETTIVPAVVSENIHIERTEIVTKAIHRDVHVDHYYTYIQPIPVTEVLPARHFTLDPTTGIKTEIAAPPGFTLPAHLQPRRAEDYSHLRKTTRHYVVDEDHPNGMLEDPPRAT